MSQGIRKFKCEECSKEVEQEGFPYNLNWKYIYELEWKVTNKIRASMHDVKFCSKECVIEHLKKHL